MNVICHASLPESMPISVQAVNATAFCLANCVAEFDCILLFVCQPRGPLSHVYSFINPGTCTRQIVITVLQLKHTLTIFVVFIICDFIFRSQTKLLLVVHVVGMHVEA